jgi:chromate reductase
MAKPKILAFAGSTGSKSFNKKLVKVAAAAARAAGAEVTEVDLKDYPLPLYDSDLEAKDGLPANAKKLQELMKAHRGLLISSPEYNSSISGVLKNTIDWLTRTEKAEPSLACFEGKVAALLAASPGALGGLRGLVTVRSILSNIKVLVLPDQVAVGKAHEAFGDDGKLKDAKQQKSIDGLAAELVRVAGKLD